MRCLIQRSRDLLMAMGAIVMACGAGQSFSDASAEPRQRARSAPRSQPAPRPKGPPPITAGNVEKIRKKWETTIRNRGKAVALHEGLARVAVSGGTSVNLYSLRDGKKSGRLRACPDILRGGLNFVERKLLVVCRKGINLFDPVGLQRLKAPPIHPEPVTAVTVSWPWIALGHRDGVVRIYGLNGTPTTEITVPGPPIDVKSLALTRDGQRLAVAWVQGSIWWWETANPQKFNRLVRHTNESDSLAFNNDGTLFAEEGRLNFSTIWSFPAPPAEIVKIRNGAWIKRLLFTSDSKWLIRGGSDGLELAQVEGPRRVVLDSHGQVEDVAFDERGAHFAAVDRNGRLTVWAARGN